MQTIPRGALPQWRGRAAWRQCRPRMGVNRLAAAHAGAAAAAEEPRSASARSSSSGTSVHQQLPAAGSSDMLKLRSQRLTAELRAAASLGELASLVTHGEEHMDAIAVTAVMTRAARLAVTTSPTPAAVESFLRDTAAGLLRSKAALLDAPGLGMCLHSLARLGGCRDAQLVTLLVSVPGTGVFCVAVVPRCAELQCRGCHHLARLLSPRRRCACHPCCRTWRRATLPRCCGRWVSAPSHRSSSCLISWLVQRGAPCQQQTRKTAP